jgi:NADH-quinone oxidoreductase subunit M
MPESDLLLMSLLIFLPSVWAVLLLFFPRGSDEYMRWFTLLGTALTLVVSLLLFIDFQNDVLEFYRGDPEGSTLSRRAEADNAQRQGVSGPGKERDLVARARWIERFNIEYFLGIDGISLPLVLLTTVITFLAMLASWGITRYVRGYCMLLLFLETGMLGTFLALDFFLFYIFWEIMLLPMYFLIGVWGGPRREYAAIKFFLYTLLGSVFILIALLAFYFTDIRDFVTPQAAEKARAELAKKDPKLSPEKVKEQASVNSFDLLALQRAGRAARQLLNGKSAREVAEEVALENQKQLLFSRKDLKVLARLKDLEKRASKAEKGKKGPEPALDEAEEKERKALLAQIPEIARQVFASHEAYLKSRLNPEQLKALTKGKSDEKKAVLEELTRSVPREAAALVEKRLDQAFFKPIFQYIMFVLLFIGFAIKVPMVPFHTWLPDAHVEAPTPISMILAGVLLKFGGYGILRIAYPICPWAAEMLAWPLAVLGTVNIVYGAFTAMAQTDFKKLVAYSSISHMGYVILGIAVWSTPERSQYWQWGMNGAMFQMIAHGITSAGMFFLVGVIYDRAHHRNLNNFRGLYDPMPLYGGISAIIFFAAMGLPGMCGFVGEFFVILSTWNFTPDVFPEGGKVLAVLAALTVVLTAAYILWTLQRVYLGTNPAYKDYPDINGRELVTIVPLVVLAVLLGVLPFLLLNMMEPHVSDLVNTLAQLWR